MKLADEVRVIDADTHMTERHDLFTSRAPERYKEGPARGGGVIDRAGNKYAFEECKHNGIDWVHEGAWDREARLRYMDENGFYA